jgi:opacity protein-like surface antigen
MRSVVVLAIALVCGATAARCASADDPFAPSANGDRRLYASGIIGDSFTTIASGGVNTAGGSPVTNTGAFAGDLFTAGGALGAAAERPFGELRVEVEALGRGTLTGQTNSVFPPEQYAVQATDSWTVMANLWREYSVSDRLGVYGGGGIGAGGYRIAVDDLTVSGAGPESVFAWQVGTGVTWQITQRATLDLGYRYLDLGVASTPLALANGAAAGNYTSALSASEWLLSVRIYEPFAMLRR